VLLVGVWLEQQLKGMLPTIARVAQLKQGAALGLQAPPSPFLVSLVHVRTGKDLHGLNQVSMSGESDLLAGCRAHQSAAVKSKAQLPVRRGRVKQTHLPSHSTFTTLDRI
jgi:hypothetical protein